MALSNDLLDQKEQILSEVASDSSYGWLVKRMLVLHLKVLPTESSDVVIECLRTFTDNETVLSYLIDNG